MVDSMVGTTRPRLGPSVGRYRPWGTLTELAALHPHRVVETSRVAVAQHVSSKLMSPNSIRLGRHRTFHMQVSAAKLAGSTLLGVDFRGSDPVITADEPTDYYTVFVLLDGTVSVSGSFGEARVAADQMFVASPTSSLRMHFNDTAFLSLKIPRRVLARQFASLTGRPWEGRFAFSPIVANPSEAAPMGELMRMASRTVGRHTEHAMRSGLAAGLQNSLLTTLMISQPSTHTRYLLQPEDSATRGALCEAADLLQSDRDDLSVAQVAALVGLSVRTLQSGFRRVYGVTPSQLQRDARLDRVHGRLLEADPATGITVSAIAHEGGFAHLGRFSAEYRRRFGVLPSTTLRLD